MNLANCGQVPNYAKLAGQTTERLAPLIACLLTKSNLDRWVNSPGHYMLLCCNLCIGVLKGRELETD